MRDWRITFESWLVVYYEGSFYGAVVYTEDCNTIEEKES